MLDAVGEDELDTLVESQPAGWKLLGQQAVGVLVFVPGEDFGLPTFRDLTQLLGHAGFFKDRADDVGIAGGGEDPGEKALGLTGVDACEVGERRAAGDAESGDAAIGHEGAGFVGAGLALGECNGRGFVTAVFKCGDRRGEGAGLFLCLSLPLFTLLVLGEERKSSSEGRGGKEEAAAGGHRGDSVRGELIND